jgi:hypothetical protein
MQAPVVHLFLPFLLLLCCHNIPNPRLPIVVTIIIIFFFAGSRHMSGLWGLWDALVQTFALFNSGYRSRFRREMSQDPDPSERLKHIILSANVITPKAKDVH